jgi:hypothetical protein
VRIQVLRAFCIAGLRQEVGSIIDVADSLGREVVQMGKAAIAREPDAAPAAVESATRRTSKKDK